MIKNSQSRFFFRGALAIMAGVVVITAWAQGSGSWEVKDPMPYERAEIAVAELDGKIYVMTGQSPGVQANGFTQVYDPVTGEWQDLAYMPSVASHAGAATVNGKIYVVGGFVANVHVGAVNRVFEFDPENNSWRSAAPLSAPRGSPAVVALNGKIHAIAGRNVEMEMQTTHEVYDPASDTWTMAAPIPEARDHTGVAVVDGKIHVFGGRNGATANRLGSHYVYDPTTDSWTSAAPLTTPRSAGVSFYLDGRIVYAGGECEDRSIRKTFEEVEAYDPESDRWTPMAPMPVGRHASGAVVINGEAYIIGGNMGCGGSRPAKDVLVFK
jgi:N-acetylneuraminic acid mutarotase